MGESVLLEFSVSNFKAIAEKQTLSMVAGTNASKSAQFSFETRNSFAPNALRVACIFGPNASGKSSFVEAINFFQIFVESSATDLRPNENIEINSFKLDQKLSDEPSEFEIKFILENALYQYGFSISSQRVVSEWLFTRSNVERSQMRMLFQRDYTPEVKSYTWDHSPTYKKRDIDFIKSKTRDNALFLSTSAQHNFVELDVPYRWLSDFLRVLTSSFYMGYGFTNKQIMIGKKSNIIQFIQQADLRIVDFEVTEQDFRSTKEFEELPTEIKEKIISTNKSPKIYEAKAIHVSSNGDKIAFDFEDESDGTRKLFSYAGPILDVLEKGYTLVVDELHSSLHPYALKFIVGLFNSVESNPRNAQLIFTSHDTYVMSQGFMHKDQIWFIEKDENQAAHLYPLSDFNLRDTEAFQKAYLEGRYGAVPMIKRT
jgi:hypothetical protein